MTVDILNLAIVSVKITVFKNNFSSEMEFQWFFVFVFYSCSPVVAKLNKKGLKTLNVKHLQVG